MFENNNPSIKLVIYKIIESEKKLFMHYNETENNDRKNQYL